MSLNFSTQEKTKAQKAEDLIIKAIQIHGFFHPSMIKRWKSSTAPFAHMIVDGFEIKKMGDTGSYYPAAKKLKDKFQEHEVDLHRGWKHGAVRIKIFGNLEDANRNLPKGYWLTPVHEKERNKVATVIDSVRNAQHRYNFAKAKMLELKNTINQLENEKKSFEEKVKQFESAVELLNKI